MCHLRDRTGVSLGGGRRRHDTKEGRRRNPCRSGRGAREPRLWLPPPGAAPPAKQKPRATGETAALESSCNRDGLWKEGKNTHVRPPAPNHVGMGRGLEEGTDFCLRVKFVVKSGSLRKGKEERGSEWLNLINKMSETELARFHSPHCSFSLLFKVRV